MSGRGEKEFKARSVSPEINVPNQNFKSYAGTGPRKFLQYWFNSERSVPSSLVTFENVGVSNCHRPWPTVLANNGPQLSDQILSKSADRKMDYL